VIVECSTDTIVDMDIVRAVHVERCIVGDFSIAVHRVYELTNTEALIAAYGYGAALDKILINGYYKVTKLRPYTYEITVDWQKYRNDI
jgi:hypothetical protein